MLRIFGCVLVVLAMAAPAQAQSRRELAERLDRVEARLADLETQFLAGDPVAERLITRVDALEREQRQTTGELERITFENRRMRQELEALGVNIDRLLSGNVMPQNGEGGPANLEPNAGQGASVDPSVAPQNPNDPFRDARSASVQPLGQTRLPQPTPRAEDDDFQAGPAALAGTASVETQALPEDLFREGRSRLLDGDFAGAQESFANFVQNYPQNDLAGDAWYWLGETHFVQGEFPDATEAYIASLRANERGEKAPDALIRLGASLAALDRLDQACATLNNFSRQFPNAGEDARRKARREAARAGCN